MVYASSDEMGSDIEERGGDEALEPTRRDIRRYYCDYCGICRSKKSLIRSHVLTHHKEELEEADVDTHNGEKGELSSKQHACQECGASFRKPAHLKQHMQCHSAERSFSCPIDDCHSTYKRKDHLTRHLLKHEGKTFTCTVENCNRKFGIKGNMTRHIREFHEEGSSSSKKIHEEESHSDSGKQYVCQEAGCGKTFKYPSKLQKHVDSHVKLDYVEVICCEPGCMKTFTNQECLQAHVRSSHQYVVCGLCHTKQLKKNFKRHLRTHQDSEVPERVKCTFEGCECTFSNTSNLKQHMKAVHEGLRCFTCRIAGCGKKFPYKHVRDNHEESALHNHVQGDFVEADELLLSRPSGGRKRKNFSVETLWRKRVVPPGQASVVDDGLQYLRWLLNEDDEN